MTTSVEMAPSGNPSHVRGAECIPDPCTRVLTIGREGGGSTGTAIEAMATLCLDDLISGAWDEAVRLSHEALQLCDSHGYQELRWPLWFAQAVVAAARGDAMQAADLANSIDSWGTHRSMADAHLYGHYVRGLAAEAQGDFEEGFRQFAVLAVPAVLATARPLAAWACLDFVECALRTGRGTEAARFVEVFSVGAQHSPRAALLVASARALTAPLESGAVEVALAAVGVDRMPFDAARVKLAYAERLRRSRFVAEARSHLEDALVLFQRLDASPWVQRTSREMRAAGVAPQDRVVGPVMQSLTPQEQEIAELAAAGFTNKEIAARVYLSHRTVGAHLYRAFPKLGISTRAALRDALAAGSLASMATGGA